jgi:hypothetical protein
MTPQPPHDYLAAIGRRGGQAKVKKGFAAMSRARADKIRVKGAAARRKRAKDAAIRP